MFNNQFHAEESIWISIIKWQSIDSVKHSLSPSINGYLPMMRISRCLNPRWSSNSLDSMISLSFPGVAIKRFAPCSLIRSKSTFALAPPMQSVIEYGYSRRCLPISTAISCIYFASSLVGAITSPYTSFFYGVFLIYFMKMWKTGMRKARVFPLPVYASTARS